MSITRTIERERGKDFLRITLELREEHPALSDGFSVTAELYEGRTRQTGRKRYEKGLEPDSLGAMHETILEWVPELAPVVALHLADPSGVPMHAVANGWYYYSGSAREYEQRQVLAGKSWYAKEYATSDHDRAAQALHISPAELPTGLTKDEFESFAESLRQRWEESARAARELIERTDWTE